MFDRKQLKFSARAHLRRAHWWVVLAFMMGGSIGSGLLKPGT